MCHWMNLSFGFQDFMGTANLREYPRSLSLSWHPTELHPRYEGESEIKTAIKPLEKTPGKVTMSNPGAD